MSTYTGTGEITPPKQLSPQETILEFLKGMRASGSWDAKTLDRAIDVASNVVQHAAGPDQRG